MTVKEIVRQYLIEHGFDGLYNDDGDCACLCDDLAPCGEMSEHCEAGYSRPGEEGSGFDFIVGPRPAEEEGEEV